MKVCADPACDSDEQPPPGESWCRRRLGIELWRWVTGYDMKCGKPKAVGLTAVTDTTRMGT